MKILTSKGKKSQMVLEEQSKREKKKLTKRWKHKISMK